MAVDDQAQAPIVIEPIVVTESMAAYLELRRSIEARIVTAFGIPVRLMRDGHPRRSL